MGEPLTDELVYQYTGISRPPIKAAFDPVTGSEVERRRAARASGYQWPTEFEELDALVQAKVIALYRIDWRIEAMSSWWKYKGPGANK